MKLNLFTIAVVLASVWLAYTDDYGDGYDRGALEMCRQLTEQRGEVDVGRCVVTLASGSTVAPRFQDLSEPGGEE